MGGHLMSDSVVVLHGEIDLQDAQIIGGEDDGLDLIMLHLPRHIRDSEHDIGLTRVTALRLLCALASMLAKIPGSPNDSDPDAG